MSSAFFVLVYETPMLNIFMVVPKCTMHGSFVTIQDLRLHMCVLHDCTILPQNTCINTNSCSCTQLQLYTIGNYSLKNPLYERTIICDSICLIVSSTTPTIMINEVPPNETFAPKAPEKIIGKTATIVSPTAPIKIT